MNIEQKMQDEIDALQIEARLLLNKFSEASEAEKEKIRTQLKPKQETIMALQRELRDFQMNSLSQIVTALQSIVANEAAGQADIVTRIEDLIQRLRAG